MRRLLLVPLFVLPFFVSIPAGEAQTVLDLERQIVVLTNRLNELRALLFPAQEGFSFNRDLFLGLWNDGDVRRLQEVLVSLGLLSDVSVDGNFGLSTRAAVQNYQRRHGISSTGYVGPLTRGALNNEPVLAYRIRPQPAYDLALLARNVQEGVNAARRARGLRELVWDDQSAEVARLHSEDQSRDNVELTDPNLLCAYPLIRHENFSGAFRVGDRLRAGGVGFDGAGENIIIFSSAENILYRSSDGREESCRQALGFAPGSGTLRERRELFLAAFEDRLEAARSAPVAVWVNKEWMTSSRIAERAVTGWMNSPGHRDNILAPEFTRGGVGIAAVNEFLVITHVLLLP